MASCASTALAAELSASHQVEAAGHPQADARVQIGGWRLSDVRPMHQQADQGHRKIGLDLFRGIRAETVLELGRSQGPAFALPASSIKPTVGAGCGAGRRRRDGRQWLGMGGYSRCIFLVPSRWKTTRKTGWAFHSDGCHLMADSPASE